jgi:hypothetical protein
MIAPRSDARHLIVWCQAPILHPCAIDPQLFSEHSRLLAWQHIQQRGLSGLHNCSNARLVKYTYSGRLLDTVQEQLIGRSDAEDEVRRAIWHAGRFVRDFVENRYGEDHEAVWFANPPVSWCKGLV